MSKTRWTDEQIKAITTSGSNIIVSAGAGSGKTAVLTERIIEKLKQGISLEELVVLTFTNAAAFEMKERVKNKIITEIENGNTSLEKQLPLLDSANICTFDSFSLSLVKKYHYLLGLEKNINICDSVVLVTRKKEIMNDVFTRLFTVKNEPFLKFMDTFSMKDDSKLQNHLYSMAQKLESLHNKEEYLETYMDTFYSDVKIEKNMQEYIEMILKEIDQIIGVLGSLGDRIVDPILIRWHEKLYGALSPLDGLKEYDKIVSYFPSSLPSFPTSQKIEEEDKEEIKPYYQIIRKSYDQLKDYLSYTSEEQIREEIISTRETVEAILLILTMYEKEVLAFKKKYQVFEFSDIGRFGVELLEKHPSIRKMYQESIKEIMIDEYQDTNDIGDYFVSLIACNNLYMVGDVKQSIYGFRNANPAIFMEKYDQYSTESSGVKIDLMKNFRSREEVLTSINLVFEKMMDKEIGGADYTNGHEMIFGNQVYEGPGKNKEDHHIEVLRYPFERGEYRKEEIEAFLIASDISNKIKEKYTVLDKETSVLRKATYRDFTILMDRKTDFDLYKKIFTYLEIPLQMHKEESFIESDEIFVLKSILGLLSCIKEKKFYDSSFAHFFMSLARSFLFSYTDDEIFTVFLVSKEKEESIYITMKNSPVFKDLYTKISDIYSNISMYSLRELLEEIYITFSFYEKINRLGNVELLAAKLEYLLSVADVLEGMEYSLEDFIAYFDEAMQNKLDVSFQMEASSENAVQMMTIHKSKGLEFPVCYYSGLYKTFSKADFKDRYLLNDTYGLVVPVYREGIKDTIYKMLVKESYYKKDIAEKIRLLYVALTRAKEKMIVVTSFKEEEGYTELVPASIRSQYRSFADMFQSIYPVLSSYIRMVDINSISLTHKYDIQKNLRIEEMIPKKEVDLEMISLSLEKEIKEKKGYAGTMVSTDKDLQKKLEIGKQVHMYLEYMDFENRSTFYKENEVNLFYQAKLENFFQMDFMKDLKNPIYYKEYEFIDHTGKMGVIDLLIETKEFFLVIDYKLKEIQKESYQKQVNAYINYMKEVTDKKVIGYLYSIIDEKSIKVK